MSQPVWIQPDRPHVTRSGRFLVGAVLAFPIVGGFVWAAAPRLALLQHRALPVLTANHLLTLAWGTAIAIGALHQLLPAAAGVRRDPGPEVTAQFVVHVLGVLLLAAGFWTRHTGLLIGGGSLIVASILTTLGVAVVVLRRRTRWSVSLTYVTAALAALGLTVLWGLLLALNWRLAFWRALLLPMGLQVHLSLGLVGWFGLLIVGVSYYLLPRFTTMKDLTRVRPAWVLGALLLSIACLMTGAFVAAVVTRIGLLLAALAGFLYTADMLKFLAAWREKARDLTRTHWQIVAAETLVLSLGAAARAVGLIGGVRWLLAGVVLFLLGWVTLTITGQAYKVTPFLMWHYRFALGMPALEVPRLEAPYWPQAGTAPMLLLAAGGLLISLGALGGWPAVGYAGGAAFFAGACLFSYLLGYSWLPVVWRARRPAPIPGPP